ncbi:hypothetical protein PC115_g25874, partial [Phytophthora cactorum]
TDHDTVAGVSEAQRAGREYGIDVVAGVEISTRAGGKDIHVLGYYVNTEDEQFLERLRGLREAREERNHLIIAKLQELGLEISWQEVIDGLGRPLEPDESIGRPHMADVLANLDLCRFPELHRKRLASGLKMRVVLRLLPILVYTETMNWFGAFWWTPILTGLKWFIRIMDQKKSTD